MKKLELTDQEICTLLYAVGMSLTELSLGDARTEKTNQELQNKIFLLCRINYTAY